MWNCTDLQAQIFTLDALNGRLTIGGFCVESGKPGDQLPIA